jgi:hypothetical protein
LTVIRHYSDPRVGEAPGDTRWLAAIVAITASWHGCAVFKVREEAPRTRTSPQPLGSPAWAGLSKLNSMRPLPAASGDELLRPAGVSP